MIVQRAPEELLAVMGTEMHCELGTIVAVELRAFFFGPGRELLRVPVRKVA